MEETERGLASSPTETISIATSSRRQFSKIIAVAIGTLAVGGRARVSPCGPGSPDERLTLKTRLAAFSIDSTGAFSAITANGRNCLAPGQRAPVLSVRVDGKLHSANRATWDAAGNTLTLDFDGTHATAVVLARAKPAHVTFELTQLRTAHHVELVLWGPFPISIHDLVGELVGVLRDGDHAVGIQALNPKTLGDTHPTKATSNLMACWRTTRDATPACRTN